MRLVADRRIEIAISEDMGAMADTLWATSPCVTKIILAESGYRL